MVEESHRSEAEERRSSLGLVYPEVEDINAVVRLSTDVILLVVGETIS